MKGILEHSIGESARVREAFFSERANIDALEQAALIMARSLESGRKILTCGNGGSLCDATHFAEELTGRFRLNRRPLPAIAINDAAHITCVANDYGYDFVFSKFVEAHGRAGDTLVCFSTSGNSPNILHAAASAKSLGMNVVAMTKAGETPLGRLADALIGVPHDGFSDRIQELHITAVHIIIECVESLVGV